MITYKQAFDKITEAYIANRLDPWNPDECFIGNLLGTCLWNKLQRSYSRANPRASFEALRQYVSMKNKEYKDMYLSRWNIEIPTVPPGQEKEVTAIEVVGYTAQEILYLEYIFLEKVDKVLGLESIPGDYFTPYVLDRYPSSKTQLTDYEDALYEAMVITLDELKEIHKRRGEDVEPLPFSKRLKPCT